MEYKGMEKGVKEIEEFQEIQRCIQVMSKEGK